MGYLYSLGAASAPLTKTTVIPTGDEHSEAQWRDLFLCLGDKKRSLDYAAPWATSLGMTEGVGPG